MAKEYVAAPDADDPGVLVLSRFAGAAERLLDVQLVVPCDTGAIADTLQRTLHTSLDERRQRHQALLAEIRRHDVHRWRGMFLDTSKETSS